MMGRVVVRMIPLILAVPLIVALADSRPAVDSPKGFDGQYKEVVSAYVAGNEKSVQLLLDEFRIPSSWFAETFGPEKGDELENQYRDQHTYFKFITLRKFEEYKVKKASSIHTYSMNGVSPKPAPAPPPAVLKPLPKIQGFQIGTSAAAWLDSFTFVDGKFRFFGKGAYPFWDPVRVHLADPCSGIGVSTTGGILHKVAPVYPAEAQSKHVQGFVRMRVTVATNGSVKAVEIVDGDPLLVEAAKQAVMQWRYTPFVMCGKIVEMQSMEHVKFPPE
ncbi:MAG TPA: energy transducer TonB [Candidatus Acidoferrales bacterium]